MNDVFNDNVLKKMYRFFTNRLLILFIVFCILFYVLVARLFQLQIVEGETYLNSLVFTTLKTLTIPAPRGTIYDRYGRPLAVNLPAFTVKIDPSVQVDALNDMLYELIKVFERHNQEYVDEFPISKEEPYVFLFNDVKDRELEWKNNMDIPAALTAPECIEYLRKQFKVLPELSNTEARKLLQLRSMLYMQRYRQYKPITIAYGVEKELVVSLEEGNSMFPGVYIDVESLREYPYGEQFSHLLGYIRAISDSELKANEGKGYTNTDLFGKAGIERAFESRLKGTNGEMVVEVDNFGRRVRTVSVEEPIQGDKIFLTTDQRLTEKCYEILKGTLVEIIKNKLQGLSKKEDPITIKQFFTSMLSGNSISIKKIMEAHEDSFTYNIRKYIIEGIPTAQTNYVSSDDQEKIKEFMTIGINNGAISATQMVFTLYELDVITLSAEYIERLKSGKLSILSLILEKLDSGEITPQMTNLDPCTGSIIVTDVKNGDVLASVGYPTYDNNEFVNNFNNEYWTKLNTDPNTPMINRPFYESRAPGSTFKMLTAIATLQAGAIKPTTTIYDERIFTDAGYPYAKCHASYSHRSLDVAHALEVSCNYFFCDAAYRMGNAKSGTEKDSIAILNDYMIQFGFNDRTGVEVGEYRDEYRESIPIISGPAFKEYSTLRWYPNAEPSQYAWLDGDTIRTAFGQSENNYTAATMAKYIATLASGGQRLQLHLLNKIETQSGELIQQFEPVIETEIEITPENLEAVYNGMILVTEGKSGTARTIFADFPVRVAGKTGTAQEKVGSRSDHSSFGGFAPYEDPQISVYVLIPYGSTETMSAPAAQVAKKVIEEYMQLNQEPEKSVFSNSLAK